VGSGGKYIYGTKNKNHHALHRDLKGVSKASFWGVFDRILENTSDQVQDDHAESFLGLQMGPRA
jgi:hypothetical protein